MPLTYTDAFQLVCQFLQRQTQRVVDMVEDKRMHQCDDGVILSSDWYNCLRR